MTGDGKMDHAAIIERMAKAMCECHGRYPSKWDGDMISESDRDQWRNTARIALGSVREPEARRAGWGGLVGLVLLMAQVAIIIGGIFIILTAR